MQNNQPEYTIETKNLFIFYGSFPAVSEVNMKIEKQKITAIIGPSGCGKSTLLRAFNRMNDFVSSSYVTGEILMRGQNLYAPNVDPVQVRRSIGMVFQKPNPFPQSIYDNVAFGPCVMGMEVDLDEVVETSLKRAALWDDVKNDLKADSMGLALGQQQRLCIARVVAVKPEVILMDESTSALDPIATLRVEELIAELKRDYTIVIVTHNMQQAARVSDFTGLFWLGELVEFAPTSDIFTNPKEELTEAYVTGRMG